MIRRFPLYIIAAIITLSVFPGCNSALDVDPEIEAITSSSVAVTSFSLGKNEKVLSRLDSVFFSIDLNSGQIFNADSLPKGTDVTKLQVNIGLPDVKEAVLIEPLNAEGKAVEHDYLESSKDSIDFSRGPVTLRVVSADEEYTREYVIKVNVHDMVPDSLYWNQLAMRALPGGIDNPTAQETVMYHEAAYCFVTDGSNTVIAVNPNPWTNDWVTATANIPAGADLNTVTATADALYLLDEAGELYTSADGVDWTDCSVKLSWLYGEYNGSLMASRHDGDTWTIVSYPSMDEQPAAADMPVTGTSALVGYDSKWSLTPITIMLGGVTADGSYVDSTWGYDGTTWAPLSENPLPAGLQGVTLIPYVSYVTDSKNWVVRKYATLVALGGRKADGSLNDKVYISLDEGIRWKLADDLMQLPSYIPAMSDSQGLVFSATLSRSADCWREFPSKALPVWLMIERPVNTSRAVAPITEWDCSYIYLFGGYDRNGKLCNTVWRGVINRLTFKPLQ